MTRGRPFLYRQRFWCVLHVLYVNFNHYLVFFFFFNTRMPCTDRDGCRAAETEAGGNEYFLDVNSWPQGKKSETEGKTVSFRWVLSICQLQNTEHFHPVVFFSPCHVWRKHPGWTFSQLSCGSAWLKSLVHGVLLNPPQHIFFSQCRSSYLLIPTDTSIFSAHVSVVANPYVAVPCRFSF